MWSALSDAELWEHVAAMDSLVYVGLRMPGMDKGVNERGQSLVPRPQWDAFADRVRDMGLAVTKIDTRHPLLSVRLDGPKGVAALRRSPFVEFVEPRSFPTEQLAPMSSGCSEGDETSYETRSTGPSGDVIPYSYPKHRIPQAWNRATGAGITVGIVDTGVSVWQSQFDSQWDDGQSSGRSISKTYTNRNNRIGSPGPYHDSCGHGTRILGLMAAPMDGRSVVGIAYRANAVAVRGLPDPVMISGDWDKVRDGIEVAANSAKVINMSFGGSFYSSAVENTIQYWHGLPGTQGRLFIGATGTGVPVGPATVFPAYLDEVTAVTGIEPWSYGDTPCDDCSYGAEFASWVDVAALWKRDGETANIGGTSGAAGAISGIAALVWSEYPQWTRAQVLERMRVCSRYPDRRPYVGYGPPDAMCATGGVIGAGVTGPSTVQASISLEFGGETTTFGTYVTSMESGAGRYQYSWSGGGQASTKEVGATCSEVGASKSVSVTITDTTDGTTYTRSKSYTVVDQTNACSSGGGDIPPKGDPEY